MPKTLRSSRKQRPSFEVLCELVYRPLAQLVVWVLLPLRVPPPAVALTSTATGFWGAYELWHGNLLTAALILQLKTVLDNADGQLARASGRVTVLGRYLDSESDLIVNAAIFVALGHTTGRPVLAACTFVVLTIVLSVDFNCERLYRVECGERPDASPAPGTGPERALAFIYRVAYAPQDRVVERFVEWRLRRIGASEGARRAFHDRATLQVLVNYGLSTELAVLGICLAAGSPVTYLWIVLGLGCTLLPLEARRERRARAYHETAHSGHGER